MHFIRKKTRQRKSSTDSSPTSSPPKRLGFFSHHTSTTGAQVKEESLDNSLNKMLDEHVSREAQEVMDSDSALEQETAGTGGSIDETCPDNVFADEAKNHSLHAPPPSRQSVQRSIAPPPPPKRERPLSSTLIPPPQLELRIPTPLESSEQGVSKATSLPPSPPGTLLYKNLETALNTKGLGKYFEKIKGLGINTFEDMSKLDPSDQAVWPNLNYMERKKIKGLVDQAKEVVELSEQGASSIVANPHDALPTTPPFMAPDPAPPLDSPSEPRTEIEDNGTSDFQCDSSITKVASEETSKPPRPSSSGYTPPPKLSPVSQTNTSADDRQTEQEEKRVSWEKDALNASSNTGTVQPEAANDTEQTTIQDLEPSQKEAQTADSKRGGEHDSRARQSMAMASLAILAAQKLKAKRGKSVDDTELVEEPRVFTKPTHQESVGTQTSDRDLLLRSTTTGDVRTTGNSDDRSLVEIVEKAEAIAAQIDNNLSVLKEREDRVGALKKVAMEQEDALANTLTALYSELAEQTVREKQTVDLQHELRTLLSNINTLQNATIPNQATEEVGDSLQNDTIPDQVTDEKYPAACSEEATTKLSSESELCDDLKETVSKDSEQTNGAEKNYEDTAKVATTAKLAEPDTSSMPNVAPFKLPTRPPSVKLNQVKKETTTNPIEPDPRAKKPTVAPFKLPTRPPSVKLNQVKKETATNAMDPDAIPKPGFAAFKLPTHPRPSSVEIKQNTEKQDHACSDFKLNMSAAVFNTCQCGWPKADHSQSDPSPNGTDAGDGRNRWKAMAKVGLK